MTKPDPVQTACYELQISPEAMGAADKVVERGDHSLPESILARNVIWFCKLRWIIIAILFAFGILSRVEGLFQRIGFLSPGLWPFVLSGILVLCNVVYLGHARWSRLSHNSKGSSINIRAQIFLDLLLLTTVVHFLGSIQTYIPFAYLFHIVLACVFFPRRQSLGVVIIASTMFATCISLENYGFLENIQVFTDGQFALSTRAYMLSFPSAVGIWLVVWYLASSLSDMVRTRDIKLAKTNRRLVAAQKERSKHMLTMTHQLKAPFAAIHASAQLLQKGYCGMLSDKALKEIERIAARSRRLAIEIQEMLQLANLSSSSQKLPDRVELSLSKTLSWCVEQVQPLAMERGITLHIDIHPARTRGFEDHLKMLFGNILSNAVRYSHRGGRVYVQCKHEDSSLAVVTIKDEGIGIVAEKLPNIFDEHYRTKEGVRHNKESSGLGLAIVKQVAVFNEIRLQVQSQVGVGTTFKLWFPT